MNFKVKSTPTFEKRFKKILNKKMQNRVAAAIRTLFDDPYGVTKISNIVKLKGSKNIYRIRIGDYRVFYEINRSKKEVVILTVEDRKDCY